MKIVRIIKDWKEPDIFRQTPEWDGVWDNIKFTFDPIEYCDYLIVLTRPPYDISVKCPQGNAWLVSFEPPTTFHKFHLKSYKYFDKIFTQHNRKIHQNHIHIQGGLPWQINKSYKELIDLPPGTGKANKVSTIVSDLNWMKGHEVRLNFINYLKKTGFDLDFFGRGVNPIDDKFEALYPYKYSIAFENSSYNHYWTEKISDCFLSWTMPIYWGSPNILNYFPKESLMIVDPGKPEKSLNIIEKAIEGNLWKKNLGAIEEARNRVLNKYQFFPHLVNQIKNNELKINGNTRKFRYNIPYNPAPWEPNYKVTLLRKIEFQIRKAFNLKPY